MHLIFMQNLIHHKIDAHIVIICLISAYLLVFQFKHYKMEVFETNLLFFFHLKTHFYMTYISF